uniref:Putative secreted protein n=1 Tax=Ixodes scapularis TaxID=6945 RepID=A0A4D5RZ67_IXOSC
MPCSRRWPRRSRVTRWMPSSAWPAAGWAATARPPTSPTSATPCGSLASGRRPSPRALPPTTSRKVACWPSRGPRPPSSPRPA